MTLPPLDDPSWRELAYAVAEAHRAALVRRWRNAQLEHASAEVEDALVRLRALERGLYGTTTADSAPTVPTILPRTSDGEILH